MFIDILFGLDIHTCWYELCSKSGCILKSAFYAILRSIHFHIHRYIFYHILCVAITLCICVHCTGICQKVFPSLVATMHSARQVLLWFLQGTCQVQDQLSMRQLAPPAPRRLRSTISGSRDVTHEFVSMEGFCREGLQGIDLDKCPAHPKVKADEWQGARQAGISIRSLAKVERCGTILKLVGYYPLL